MDNTLPTRYETDFFGEQITNVGFFPTVFESPPSNFIPHDSLNDAMTHLLNNYDEKNTRLFFKNDTIRFDLRLKNFLEYISNTKNIVIGLYYVTRKNDDVVRLVRVYTSTLYNVCNSTIIMIYDKWNNQFLSAHNKFTVVDGAIKISYLFKYNENVPSVPSCNFVVPSKIDEITNEYLLNMYANLVMDDDFYEMENLDNVIQNIGDISINDKIVAAKICNIIMNGLKTLLQSKNVTNKSRFVHIHNHLYNALITIFE